MKIQSFDPGITTGWAEFEDAIVMQTRAFPIYELEEFLRSPQNPPRLIVIEAMFVPTIGKMNRDLRRVISLIESFAEARSQVIRIPPGVWKTRRFSKELNEYCRTLRTPHERDAVRLGLVGIETALAQSQK